MNFVTLLFFALAVFVGWKLWSVLGETTGHEKPPQAPVLGRKSGSKDNSDENKPYSPVEITDDSAETYPQQSVESWTGLVAPGSKQEGGLREISLIDKDFDARAFQEGAKAAYEMIVEAFAKAERSTLKDFLSRDVYDNFDAALKEREANGELVETTFVSIDKADFTDVTVDGKTAYITVTFSSKMITYTQDREGRIIDGDPNTIVDVHDAWTFSRILGSRDPNWTLVETQEA